MRARTIPHRLLLGLLALVLSGAGVLTGAVPAAADEAPKVLLLLDVSGSMNGKISGGGTKFAAAKKALKQVAASLPAGTQVGLRVYGSEISEDQTVNPAACKDTKLVLPIGPLNQAQMDRAVDSFDAKGETPIAYSLGKAVDDLGNDGKRVLILISDGRETCDGDPCPTAKKLADSGVDLQFNAVGLAVDATARKQLQCIAKAGRGSYSDANNTDSLDQALRKLTQRALRPFEVAGTTVTATTDPAAAPQIKAGQYRDTYNTSATPRYYTIARTPGSLVTTSISTVVRPSTGFVNGDQFTLTLETTAGEHCSEGSSLSQALKSALVYTVVVRSAGSQYPSGSLPSGCTQDAQLRLEVTRANFSGAPDSTVPVQLDVTEQPEVVNRSSLPAPVADYTGEQSRLPATSKTTSVVGGSGFSNAPEISAGAWSDTLAFGDTVLYKVHLDYGQTLRVTASLPGDKGSLPIGRGNPFAVYLRLRTPAHAQLVQMNGGNRGDDAVHLSASSPQVRVRNDELRLPGVQNSPNDADASTANVSGDYFVVLELEPLSSGLTGIVLPLQVDIAVDGSPSGQPVFATASTTPSPAAETSTEPPTAGPASATGTPPPGVPASPSTTEVVLVVVALLVALGAVGAGSALFFRRRRKSGPGSHRNG